MLASLMPAYSDAQRLPVLRQVRLPHAYYFRELYLPQLTSGPSAVTWSPDGNEVIYSMRGSLWRQRLDSDEAIQLTDGPGYDYQPDWSRDGRHVVFVTYANDQLQLRVLDLTSGETRTLIADGTVNVEPRFNPAGDRLAWVSTAHEGRFHVMVAPFRDGTLGAAERMTEDRLRALRAVRFAGRFGFRIEPATWAAIVESAPYLPRLSRERVKQELEKTMEQVTLPSRALSLWRSAGAMRELIPVLDAQPAWALRAPDFVAAPDATGAADSVVVRLQ